MAKVILSKKAVYCNKVQDPSLITCSLTINIKKTDDDKQSRERKERLKKLIKDSKYKKIQYNKNVQVGKGILIVGVGALVYLALKKAKEESTKTIEPPEHG